MRAWWRQVPAKPAAALAAFGMVGLMAYGHSQGLPLTPLAVTSSLLAFLVYQLFAQLIAKPITGGRALTLLLATQLFGYGVYAALVAVPAGTIAAYLGYAVVLYLLASWSIHTRTGTHFALFVLLIGLWIPFDERWVSVPWPWPPETLSYIFPSVMVSIAAAILFRHTAPRRFTVRLNAAEGLTLAAGLALILGLLLPVAWATHFVTFAAHAPDVATVIVATFYILIFIALPEELIFRGLLPRVFGRDGLAWKPQILSAVLFGLSHYNNTDFIDYRYIGLATGAGLIYAWVYKRTNNLWMAVFLHALTDVIWSQFFPSPHTK